MTHQEIREKFINFFKEKGHTPVPSSSLLSADPSVLFTTAGMQQFKPYYTGELNPEKTIHPGLGKPIGKNAVSIQKCFRTSDIDEVGDESHLTFFEMLGNFSFGGYGKKEAIEYAHEFLTKKIGLEIDYVTIFKGDKEVPADTESEKIWQNLGIKNIKRFPRSENFWGPTGDEGPCGPTTEIFVKNLKSEVWNLVFNQYYCHKDKTLRELATKGIDTGMGLERITAVTQGVINIFETDLFAFGANLSRIVADHARAVVFLISDGVLPSNKEQGYVLRRLIRRITAKRNDTVNLHDIFTSIIKKFKPFYENLDENKIWDVFKTEAEKFWKTMSKGLIELNKLEFIDAQTAFKLYESYGLPYENIKDSGKAKDLTREDFDEEFKKHQKKSRAGAEKKFGGHGLVLNTGELKAVTEEEVKIVTRLHTATHLLHASLRKILGKEVKQAGSDITAERLRFDFTFPRKLTAEEIKKTEDLVNEVINKNWPVTKQEMPYEEAVKTGALSFFKQKYPNRVNIYMIGPESVEGHSSTSLELPFSQELCGGPHVSRTAEIGQFKIIKEEAVSAGVRRIRAVISSVKDAKN